MTEPFEPPPAGLWSLAQVTPDGFTVQTSYESTDSGAATVSLDPREGIELVLMIDGGHGGYGAQVSTAEFDRSDDGGSAETFAGAIELAGERLLAYAPDPPGGPWAIQALAALLAHANTSLFEIDLALLEADRDAAATLAAGEPTAAGLAGLARAHRWLDEHEAAERAQRAATERDSELAPVWERYGLDDYDAVPYWATGWDDLGGTFSRAVRDHDPLPLSGARELCAARIRDERLPPSRSDVYDWLEETERFSARLTGRPLPDHRTMLERAGLWRGTAKPRRGRAPRELGRRAVKDATLEHTRYGKLIASFHDGLVLELQHSVIWLYRGELLLELREGHRTLGEALAVAKELLPDADFALLGELLRGADAAIAAEHERFMAWQVDFDAELASAQAAGDPERIARAQRWLGRHEAARPNFAAAAAEVAAGAEDAGAWARCGVLLRHAGDEDAARRAFAGALKLEPDRWLAFELRYLLGERPEPVDARSVRARLLNALATMDHHAIEPVHGELITQIRQDRTSPTVAANGLTPYDLLEEGFTVAYAQRGWPEPDHEQMIERARLRQW